MLPCPTDIVIACRNNPPAAPPLAAVASTPLVPILAISTLDVDSRLPAVGSLCEFFSDGWAGGACIPKAGAVARFVDLPWCVPPPPPPMPPPPPPPSPLSLRFPLPILSRPRREFRDMLVGLLRNSALVCRRKFDRALGAVAGARGGEAAVPATVAVGSVVGAPCCDCADPTCCRTIWPSAPLKNSTAGAFATFWSLISAPEMPRRPVPCLCPCPCPCPSTDQCCRLRNHRRCCGCRRRGHPRGQCVFLLLQVHL